MIRSSSKYLAMAALLLSATLGHAQQGTLSGIVTFEADSSPLHNATVLITQLGRAVETGDDGTYKFVNVPNGNYDVVVRASGFSDSRKSVRVDGSPQTLNFELRLATVQQQITVTASGREETAFESFQSVNSLESVQLVEEAATSLGEVLDNQPGVAKRSFGVGNARPVLRGFSGDRVLVMKDNMPTGSLSSQSADHGESVDVLALERLEVVKGPATLLYGSSAIGGVVNAITPQDHADYPHEGVRGYVSGTGGTTNAYGGFGAGIEFGHKEWMFWGSGGGQRTGNYDTPIGEINNSKSRTTNGNGGFGFYGNKPFFSVNLAMEDFRFGIPFAGLLEGEPDANIDIDGRRANARVAFGLRNLEGWANDFRFTVDYSDYRHKELEIEDGDETTGTVLDNDQLGWRFVLNQKKRGPLMGSFGASGFFRDYQAVGAEALAPPTSQDNFAVFTLQNLTYEKIGFQFGGRVEHNSYSSMDLADRDFTGFSGAAGIRVPLWTGGAFVTNFTHSYRAPALEELFYNGPHPGNLTFEIGNLDLVGERSNGVDMSVRHQGDRLHAEANFFFYDISDFVFLAPTGNVEDGLNEAEYLQGDSRFVGGELSTDIGMHKNVWLTLGLDVVNATLKQDVTAKSTGLTTPQETPLPRIPPIRGRVGLDFRFDRLSIRPEAVIANAQEDLFVNETRTAGYTVFNLAASYTIPTNHAVHVFSVNGFNLGDRLYRNHLSFIKDLAPEIGRGVKVGYTVRFF